MEEWCELVEARRCLLRPHLDTFTLSTLGRLECLRREVSFSHSIFVDSPKCESSGGRFSLDTQGIFEAPQSSRIVTGRGYEAPLGCISAPDGVMYAWGLTRKAEWVIVGVTFVGEPGYKDRGYERATHVDIEEADLRLILKLCKCHPEAIWLRLGKEICGWSEGRAHLAEIASDLARMVATEELALSLVPDNPVPAE